MKLFSYQHDGADFLASRAQAILGDEMGLGKTPQAIVACDRVGALRVLVLAPAAVCVNWRREFQAWQTVPREVRVIDAGDRDFGPGVHIASYDRARNPATLNALLSRRWDVLVCDEAQYLKNRDAARTQVVVRLAAMADRQWGLSGTPIPNSADEIWSLLHLFGREGLGDPPLAYWPFRKRFCAEIQMGNTGRSKIVGVRNAPDLKARLALVMLRRKKDDVLKDLPPLREAEIALSAETYARELDVLERGEAGDLIRGIMSEYLWSEDVDKAAGQMLQAASDESVSRLRRLTALIKARALGPILTAEMEQTTDKMVVMAWHRETLDTLQERLAPFGAVRLCGQTRPADRQAAIDRFQTDPSCRVFVGQIQAAGTGLTLTAASNLVFAEMSWTPSDNAQAAMRVHRIGQTRPVLIRYATLADTIDEAVVRTLRRKSQDIATVLN